MVSVAQLELVLEDNDPYDRLRPSEPGPVEIDDNLNHDENYRLYEVKKLVNKRIRRYGRKRIPVT